MYLGPDSLSAATTAAPTSGFRLTLTSATPVTTSDVTGATTVYLTPYKDNRIALYDGSGWVSVSSSEVSLALGTLTTDTNYDVFAYDSSGLTLELVVWSTDTARATGVVRQDGVWVKSGDATKRLVGTIRTTTTTTTEDSAENRFCCNVDNRVPRHMGVELNSNRTSTSTSFVRVGDALTPDQIFFVRAIDETMVEASITAHVNNVTPLTILQTGIGLDSSSTNSALNAHGFTQGNSGAQASANAMYRGYPGLGYHYLQWIWKVSSGTASVNSALADYQPGIHGWAEM